MSRRCLICESSAILTKDAAVGIVLMVGIAGGWLLAINQARKDQQSQACSSLEGWHNLLLGGLASVAPSYQSALRFAADVTRYQFGGFDCHCLRCGAIFNDAPVEFEQP